MNRGCLELIVSLLGNTSSHRAARQACLAAVSVQSTLRGNIRQAPGTKIIVGFVFILDIWNVLSEGRKPLMKSLSWTC
jgi:uncharacterized membrane protein